MAALTIETSKTIATVLLKQLITPELAASHFHIEGAAREALIHETERAIQDLNEHNKLEATLEVFTPRLHQHLMEAAEKSSPPIKQNLIEKAADKASNQNVSPYEASNVINIGGLLTPSLLLASAVLDILHDKGATLA